MYTKIIAKLFIEKKQQRRIVMDERRNIYFYHQPSQKLHNEVEKLKSLARDYEFVVCEQMKDANIIVAVGGDGTFLQAVRKSGFRQDCLYAGIATDHQTSFYCDFQLDQLNEMVNEVMNKEIEVRRYPIIKVIVDDEIPFYCLNECTVRSSIIKTFTLEVLIDDVHFETFRGDGMVISTPTGSTGYNKSTGGAVVDPLIPSFQVSELSSLNNNQYRTLGSPFILSGNRKLTLVDVEDANDFPMISMDNEAIGVSKLKKIDVTLSDKVIKTVKLKNNSFWQKVQRTFL